MNKTMFQTQISNRIGRINGRTCAVGTDWVVVQIRNAAGQGTCRVVENHGDAEDMCRATVAALNANVA